MRQLWTGIKELRGFQHIYNSPRQASSGTYEVRPLLVDQ